MRRRSSAKTLGTLFLTALSLMGLLYLQHSMAAKPEETSYFLVVSEKEDDPVEETVQLKMEDGLEIIRFEDYLIGVLMSELLPGFSPEAVKAQTVAARTYALRSMRDGKHDDCDLCVSSACCQAYHSEAALREKLGAAYDAFYVTCRDAVEQTAGEVLTYGGELIEATYFSCSGGATEAAAVVWGGDVPYLQSVESVGEENASKFSSAVMVSFAEFSKIIHEEEPGAVLGALPNTWFGNTVLSEGGGIQSMTIGGVSFSGTRLRALFSLNSTRFTTAVTRNGVEFAVEGYGHRVGMSQYGADAMARNGAGYREILTHYYTGVEITNRFAESTPRNGFSVQY